jgi:hypothetical protein
MTAFLGWNIYCAWWRASGRAHIDNALGYWSGWLAFKFSIYCSISLFVYLLVISIVFGLFDFMNSVPK